MRFRRKALVAKVESTYGTDPTPAIGTDDVLILKDVDITPVEQDEVRREIVRNEKGQDAILPTNAKARLKGSIELAGAGAAGDAPVYGPLLRACGLAETINASTSAVYDPVSESEESVAMYFHRDAIKHKMLGTRGNVALDFQAGQTPKFMFDLLGLYSAVAAATWPTTMDYSAAQQPVHVNKVNTTTFTLFGYAAVMASARLDLGNTVNERSLVNSRTIEIPDRAPTGEVEIEAPAIGTKDFLALLVAGTTGALQIVHGTTAGNIVQVDAPAVQLNGQPSYVENNGVLHIRMPFILLPDSGDDELSITVK